MSVNVKRKLGAMSLGAVTVASMFGMGVMPVMAAGDSTADMAGPAAGSNMFGTDVCAGASAEYKQTRASRQWTDTAVLKVGKTLYSKNDSQSLKAGDYTFKITPVEAKDSSGNDITSAMPTSANAVVSFSNADVANKSTVSEGVAFDNMTFTKAGYYLYDVEELPGTDNAVNYDGSHYYLVVYVVQDIDAETRDTLPYVHIENITSWHRASSAAGSDTANPQTKPNLSDLANVTDNGNNAATQNNNGTNASTIEAQGVTYGKVNITNFINGIETRDIILEKNVKGLWGDLDQDFDFTINFEGLNPGTTYVVNGAGNAAAAGVTGDGTFTAGNDGKATYTVKLKDNGQITVKDLPVGATYKITEAENDHDITYALSNENASKYATGHKEGSGANPVYASQTNATAHSGDNDKAGNVTGNDVQTADAKTYGVAEGSACVTAVETVDIGDADIKALYTNTRDFKTVTGLPEMTLPFGVAGIGAAVAALLLAAKRRKEDSGIAIR